MIEKYKCELYINEDGISYNDQVFSGSWKKFDKGSWVRHCKKEAYEMRNNHEFANYEEVPMEKRLKLAEKWELAATKDIGYKNDFFFSLQEPKDIFKDIVCDIAKDLGINYTLTIED